MADDEMAEAHARDYAVKGKLDAVVASIDSALRDPRVHARLAASERHHLEKGREACKGRSDHVVAVWD